MANPLGQGERKHRKDGNALLTTYRVQGKKINTPLWIDAFATDLNLQLDSAQVKEGLIHRPIRLSERFLVFSTLWNVTDREKYVKLIALIRNHWAFNLNEGRLTPMKLSYPGANKTWLGFIENASIGYAVTDVILTYQFQMRIIPSLTGPISQVIGQAAPYSPTSADAKHFGSQWYKIGEFVAAIVGTNNESTGGATGPGGLSIGGSVGNGNGSSGGSGGSTGGTPDPITGGDGGGGSGPSQRHHKPGQPF